MNRMNLLRKPSAFLPPLMSLIALAIVAFHVARFGTARQADEGAAAHLWQLLMAGQMPIITLFAARWLPQVPRQALPVFGLHIVAALTAAAPVFMLGF